MWKYVLAAFVAVVVAAAGIAFYLSDKIFIRWPHAQVAQAEFGRRYAPAELRADFRELTRTVEHIHPDIAAVTVQPAYDALKAKTLASLDRPMTRLEFYRVLAPFAGRAYFDGHTELLPPDEEWDAYKAGGGTVPPFAIRIDGARLVVAGSVDAQIPQGAELLAVDGVPSGELRRQLIDTQSMEAESGREAYGARRFSVRLWSMGLRPPFRLTFALRGETRTATVPGISFDAWSRAFSLGSGEPIHLTIANGVAHLVIRNFELPWDRYSGWLHDAFQKIRDAKVRAVILDLRENNGGDTRQSDELQTYLSDKALPALAEVRVHATPEVKAAYRTLLPEGFRWIPLNTVVPMLHGIQTAPDNGTFAFQPDGAAPAARSSVNDLAFGGKLYVLIGPYTYSTALIAAAPYKYWKRATFIGETTSEPMTFFGDYFEFDLPNTRLQMHVSHKMFKLFGSPGPHAGLAPDIAVSPAGPDAYVLALQDIARNSRRVTPRDTATPPSTGRSR